MPAIDGSKSTVDATIVPSVSVSLFITKIVITPSSLTIAESLLATGVAKSLSVIVTIATCGVALSAAPLPPVTFVMSAITVSLPSNIASSVGVIVTVPLVEPAGIVIVVLDAT